MIRYRRAEFIEMGPSLGTSVVVAATLLHQASALQNGFRLPQLGWNSWNHFGCHVTEQDIMDTADAFVATGMQALESQSSVVSR